MTDAPDFDWNPRNDDSHSIVVRHQPAIAVYLNPHDEVVIRQQDEYDGADHDHFVYVTRDNVLKVVERMLELAGLEQARPELLLLPTPSKGAERERRYRQRHHRNGEGVTRDVTRNGSLPFINGQHEEVLIAAE